MTDTRYYPTVGTPLYLYQRTGNYYVDAVKKPATVIGVEKNKIYVQEAKLIFNHLRYYDTLPDDIVEDKEGRIFVLNWAPTKRKWQCDYYRTGYPYYACFGKYDFYPYLN